MQASKAPRRPPLVETPLALSSDNNPLTRQIYAKLGANGVLETRPSILHFGGYTLDKVHEITLRIVNVSDVSQRLHIINPMTPFFQAHVDKKGAIAPGMSEDVVVQFRPRQWRYFYDCIRLHSDHENLLVPIHAYPVVNEVNFPRSIDLGKCLLGQVTCKTVQLSCRVPIQFDFEVRLVKPHPDFAVSPSSGVIPANGSVSVTFEYRPVRMCTVELEVELTVSQFNFTPIRCRVVASTGAGLIREGIVKQLTERANETERRARPEDNTNDFGAGADGDEAELRERALLSSTTGQSEGRNARPRYKPSKLESYDNRVVPLTHGVGSGAVKDSGGAYLGIKRTEAWARTVARLGGAPPQEVKAGEVTLEGYRVPMQLDDVTSVNFVLTQTAGKLKPKDLKQAISKQRAEREQQRREQEALAKEQRGSGLGETRAEAMAAREAACVAAAATDAGEEGGAGSRQMRELVFLQELHEIDKEEKEREFTSAAFIGEDPMAEEEMAQVVEARVAAEKARAAERRQRQRDLHQTAAYGLASKPARRACGLSLNLYDVGDLHQPSFDINRNDNWQMRAGILARFARAANKVIVRRRVAARLKALNERLAAAGVSTREQCRAFVDLDNRAAEAGASAQARSGAEHTGSAPDAAVQPMSFPEYVEQESKSRKAVDAPTDVWFEHMAAVKVVKPTEAALLGYSHIPEPALPRYMSFESERTLRAGAMEECGGIISIGAEDEAKAEKSRGDYSESGTQPDPRQGGEEGSVGGSSGSSGAAQANKRAKLTLLEACSEPLAWSQAPCTRPLQLLQPDASVRALVPLENVTEDDPRHYLRPRPHVRMVPVTHELKHVDHTIGGMTAWSAACFQTISDRWRPQRGVQFSALSTFSSPADLWTPSGLPAPLAESLREDDLSDTGSDEEESDMGKPAPTAVVPTLELSRSFFLQPDAGTSEDAAGAGDVTEQVMTGGTKSEIQRDAKWLQLERATMEIREQMEAQIPARIAAVDDAVVYPRHKFQHWPGHQLKITL